MRWIVPLAYAGMAAVFAAGAWAQSVTSGSYEPETGGSAVHIQPAGDAVMLIDGDRFVSYQRQGEGLYHAYDARTDTTYALRVVDAETIELSRAYSQDAERRRLRRVRPSFVMEEPPAPVLPAEGPVGTADSTAVEGNPGEAVSPPPVLNEPMPAALRSHTPMLNFSTELQPFTVSPAAPVATATTVVDPEDRLLQLACEAAAEARTLYDPERYAEYLSRLRLAVAPALLGRQTFPCEELRVAQDG